MRSLILALPFALGCGGGSGHPVDSHGDTQVDTPAATTLTVTTYRASGPVNTQLFAVQDGDGPWTVVSGTAGVYTATLHHEHFGFAVACSGDMFTAVSTFYATISDGTAWYVDDCSDALTAATVTGTVTGAAAANPTRVINGFDFVDVAAGATTYSLPTSAGPTRMFAEELVNSRPIKIAALDTTVADGGTANFDLAAGFAPVTHALAANATIESATLSYRDGHTIARLDRSASPVTDYRGIPANQLGNGLNRLTVLGTVTATGLQEVIRYFKNPADQAITLPPMLPAISPTATSTPYPSGAATFAVQAGVSLYDLEFSTTNQTTSHDWFAEMTAAYVAKAFPSGTIAYAMPDFHALPGWQAAFQLEAGQPIDWSIGETTSINIQLFNTVPPGQFGYHDGGEEQIAGVNGQLAAP